MLTSKSIRLIVRGKGRTGSDPDDATTHPVVEVVGTGKTVPRGQFGRDTSPADVSDEMLTDLRRFGL